jgi:hypothetical protein
LEKGYLLFINIYPVLVKFIFSFSKNTKKTVLFTLIHFNPWFEIEKVLTGINPGNWTGHANW